MLDEQTGQPYLAAARRLPPGLAEHPELMEGGCYCLDTFRAGDHDGAANINVLTCSRLKKLSEGSEGFRYHASVPLIARGEGAPAGDESRDDSGQAKLGVLNLASRDWRRLSDDELRMLRTVSDLISIAIERTRLFSRSAELGAVEERNRLARDIHDTLAQSLTGIIMQLETADAVVERGAPPDEVAPIVRRALALSRRALEEARRSVHDLRAAPLEGRALGQALRALCASHEVSRQAAVTFEAVGAARPLPTRVENGLYRICQEALNNVAAHARASQVQVRLQVEPAQVTLVVRDDGVGFDPGGMGAGPEASFGLVGMNERARLMGGELEVETSWTEGTRLVVVVPTEELA